MVTLAAIVLLVGFVALYLFALHRERSLALLVSDLRISEQTFRRMGEQSLDAIIMVDANSNVTYWNPAATQMFGYAPAEIIGRSVHEVLAVERYREKAATGFNRFQATGEGEVLGKVTELAALRKDGTEFPIELSLSPMLSGNARNAIGIARDITERKLAAGQLHRRDLILKATTGIALELLATEKIDTSMPRLLAVLGEAVGADRVVMLENHRTPDGTLLVRLCSAWNSPGFEADFRISDLASNPATAALVKDFLCALPGVNVFTATPRTMPGEAGAFLRKLNVRSILLAPIPVPGEEGTWGYLGIEDCHAEREWESAEKDTIKVLAEIIAAVINRERSRAELAEAERIVENSTSVLFRLKGDDPSLPLTYISENVSRWGYTPAQFTDSPTFYLSTVHPDDQQRVYQWIAGFLAGDACASSLEFRVRFADGTYRWFENRLSIIRNESGQICSVEGIVNDTTERKEAEEGLSFANILLTTVIQSSPDGILVVDKDGRILSLNKRFLEMFEVPPELASMKDRSRVLEQVMPKLKNPEAFTEHLRYADEHPEEKVHDEIEFLDDSFFDSQSTALHDLTGGYLGRIWLFRDITERERTERELLHLARTDTLTELPNRLVFVEYLDLAFAACRRGAVPFALLFLDLDLFKEVNDTLGHRVGDILLKQVAQRLVGRMRKTDVVARFGGDEFAILQSDAVDISAAASLATEIREALSEPYEIEGNQLRATASVGIAFYTSEVSDAAGVLEQADRALYLAKQEGKNRFPLLLVGTGSAGTRGPEPVR
jgi:diguanylate cyclase (GGDEF)-like protein/PAS domain S-box-containing protein